MDKSFSDKFYWPYFAPKHVLVRLMDNDGSGLSFDLGSNSCGKIDWMKWTNYEIAELDAESYIDIFNLVRASFEILTISTISTKSKKKKKVNKDEILSACIGQIIFQLNKKLYNFFIIIKLYAKTDVHNKMYSLCMVDKEEVNWGFLARYKQSKTNRDNKCAWSIGSCDVSVELTSTMIMSFPEGGRPSNNHQNTWDIGFGMPVNCQTLIRKKRLHSIIALSESEAQIINVFDVSDESIAHTKAQKKYHLRSKTNPITIVPLSSHKIRQYDPDHNARVILGKDLVCVCDKKLSKTITWLQSKISHLDDADQYRIMGAFASELCQRVDWYMAPPEPSRAQIKHEAVTLDVDQVALVMSNEELSSYLPKFESLDEMFAHYFHVLKDMEFEPARLYHLNYEHLSQIKNRYKGGITYYTSHARADYTCFSIAQTKVFKASIKFCTKQCTNAVDNSHKDTAAYFNSRQQAIIAATTSDETRRIFVGMELVAEWLCSRSSLAHFQSQDSLSNYFARACHDQLSVLQFTCGEFTFSMLVILALSYIEMVFEQGHYKIKYALETYGTKASEAHKLHNFDLDHDNIDYDKCATDYWAVHHNKTLPSASIVKWSFHCREEINMNETSNNLTIGVGVTTRVSTVSGRPLYSIIAPNASPYKLGTGKPSFDKDFQTIISTPSNYDFYSIYGTILPYELHPYTRKLGTANIDQPVTITRIQSYNHSARNALGENDREVKVTELASNSKFFIHKSDSGVSSFNCAKAKNKVLDFKEFLDQHLKDLSVLGNIARCEVAANFESKSSADFVKDVGMLFKVLCCSLQSNTKHYNARRWSTIINFFAAGIIHRHLLVLETLDKSPNKKDFLWPIVSESFNFIHTFYSGKTSFAKHGVVGKKLTYLLRRLCLQSLPDCCYEQSQSQVVANQSMFNTFCDLLGLSRQPKFLISKLPYLEVKFECVDAYACARCFCVYHVPAASAAKVSEHHSSHPCLGGCAEQAEPDKVKISSVEFRSYLAKEKINLNSHQREFLSRMLDETDPNPLFLSGAAGSGKSRVLRIGIKCLLAREGLYRVAALALTKSAAVNIGGVTIHSYFALDHETAINDDSFTTKLLHDILMKDAHKNSLSNSNNPLHQESHKDNQPDKHKINRITNYLKYLIIDECSMVTGHFLDVLDRFLREQKYNQNVPFGGVKLILCGDPLQSLAYLNDPNANRMTKDALRFFQSHVWYDSNYPFTVINLPKVMRQNDQAFIDILNRIRLGNATQEDVDVLNYGSGKEVPMDFIFHVMHGLEAGLKNELKDTQRESTLYHRVREYGLCPVKVGLPTESERNNEESFFAAAKQRRKNIVQFQQIRRNSVGSDRSYDAGKCYAIVCEHVEADAIRNKIQDTMKTTKDEIVTCDYRVFKKFNQQEIKMCDEFDRKFQYKKLAKTLHLYVGQKVVFSDNLVSPYIASGSFGIIKGINRDEKGEVTSLDIKPLWHDDDYVLPNVDLKRREVPFDHFYESHNFLQFPITHALTWTIMLVQGLTLDGMATVILNERKMTFNYLYTAISRFRQLAYFCFLHKLTVEEVNANVDQIALAFVKYHTKNNRVISTVDYPRNKFRGV